MFAGDEISDRPPQSLIYRNDRCGLHEVLNRGHRLGIARMEVKVAVAYRKDRAASPAYQPARTSKTMIVRRKSPNGIACSADSTLKRSKNLWNSFCHSLLPRLMV